MNARTPIGRVGILLAVSLVVSLLVYARSLDNGFRNDDFAHLGHAATGSPPECIFHPGPEFAFYRPGAILLFLIEHHLFGLESGWYILFNYLIHVSIAGLLIGLLHALGFERGVAVLAGSLFLVGAGHYGKTVMWASCGGTLFAGLLSLFALTLAVRWARTLKESVSVAFPRGWAPAAWAFAVLLAAPFFHESAIVAAPLAICILAMFGRCPWKSKIICAGVMIFAALLPADVFLALRSRYPAYSVPLNIIPIAARAAVRHLGFTVVPLQPSVIADRAPAAVGLLARHVLPVHFAVGSAVLLAAVAWILSPLRRKRFVGIWLVLALAPFMLVPMPENYLELRYVYNASLPLSAFAAAAVFAALRSRRRTARIAGLTMLAYAIIVSVALTMILEKKYDASGREPGNIERLEEIRALSPS
mgnify:CR=1 FL=1